MYFYWRTERTARHLGEIVLRGRVHVTHESYERISVDWESPLV
jgi:hypothetical protein